MIDMNSFDQWMALFLVIVQRDVKENLDNLDEEEKAQTIWWKCKKWALKNITRIFERYFIRVAIALFFIQIRC